VIREPGLKRVQGGKEVLVDKGKTLAQVGDVNDAGGFALADDARLWVLFGVRAYWPIIVRPAGARRVKQDAVPVPGVNLADTIRQEIGKPLFFTKQFEQRGKSKRLDILCLKDLI
jgi:hypothetical protein